MSNRGMAGERRSSSRHPLMRVLVSLTAVCSFCLGTAAVTAAPASAALLDSCPERPTSTPFAAWGDNSSYYTVGDGTFEAGGADWTLSDATVVDDNESFYVNDPSDTQSLALAGDAQATSPTTCVDLGENTVRFFVKSSGDSDSILHVQASVTEPLTGLQFSLGYDIHGGAPTGEWSPADPIFIPNLLGLLHTGRLSLVFTTRGAPATWNVDDVYVDPFKSH